MSVSIFRDPDILFEEPAYARQNLIKVGERNAVSFPCLVKCGENVFYERRPLDKAKPSKDRPPFSLTHSPNPFRRFKL